MKICLETTIGLPPGMPEPYVVHRLLRMLLEHYHWLEPARYGGFGIGDGTIAPEGLDYEPLLATYRTYGSLCLASAVDDFVYFFPARPGSPVFKGKIVWIKTANSPLGDDWYAAQVRQVAEVMRLLDAPVAFSCVDEDMRRKRNRWISDELGRKLTLTIRDYSEGLAGLFWRNFYGPPFVRLFGERLNSLPPKCVTRMVEELVLVQPYELPTEAGTEAARAREQQLISLLGPECFYDHEHHRPPTRRPVLEREETPAPS